MGFGLWVCWRLERAQPGQEKSPALGTSALTMTAVLAYPLLTLVEGFRSSYEEGPPSVVQDWISGLNLAWGF